MKALDTNILIRFLVGDDKRQVQTVYKKFKNSEERKETLFIPTLVVLEIIWVLEVVYKVERKEIVNSIGDLMLMPILEFEKQTTIRNFINTAQDSTYDLSDILIAQSAKESGCDVVLTFDKKASQFELFERLKT